MMKSLILKIEIDFQWMNNENKDAKVKNNCHKLKKRIYWSLKILWQFQKKFKVFSIKMNLMVLKVACNSIVATFSNFASNQFKRMMNLNKIVLHIIKIKW